MDEQASVDSGGLPIVAFVSDGVSGYAYEPHPKADAIAVVVEPAALVFIFAGLHAGVSVVHPAQQPVRCPCCR